MGVEFKVSGSMLQLVFSNIRTILGFKHTMDIPFDSITGVNSIRSFPASMGVRFLGVHLPPAAVAGTFYRQGHKEFWSVVGSLSEGVEIQLGENESYRRVAFNGVTNPHDYINKIIMTIGNPMVSKKYYGIDEQNIVLRANNQDLNATITYPASGSRYPAIMLIGGSGPTDRDWNSAILPGKNGSGRLIAHELSQLGFVTIRYDKCGAGGSPLPTTLTWDHYLNEQKAVLEYLQENSAVDKNTILVLGHSEGALHAIRLAQKVNESGLAGLILLSPPGKKLSDIILAQLRQQLAPHVENALLEADLEALSQGMDSIVKGKPLPSDQVGKIAPINKLYQALSRESQIGFSQSVLHFDPVGALSSLRIPCIVVSGDKDLQIGVEDTLAFVSAVKINGKKNIECQILADVDHVLKREPLAREALGPQSALTYNSEDRQLNESVTEVIYKWANQFIPKWFMAPDIPSERNRAKRL